MVAHTVSVWGYPATVATWKTPQSPTVRLRSRLSRLEGREELYALAVAPHAHGAAEGFVGLYRTLTLGPTPLEAPTLTESEGATLERVRKLLGGVGGAQWVQLDLKADKVGFARSFLASEASHLATP